MFERAKRLLGPGAVWANRQVGDMDVWLRESPEGP
jgi:hypothetical protein